MADAIGSVLVQEHDLVAVVRNGDEVIPTAQRFSPEGIVLDVSMPGRSGLQILPELRQRMPYVAIVILTAHSEPIYVEEAFSRGTDGYVLKINLMKDLLPSISTALLSRQHLAL